MGSLWTLPSFLLSLISSCFPVVPSFPPISLSLSPIFLVEQASPSVIFNVLTTHEQTGKRIQTQERWPKEVPKPGYLPVLWNPCFQGLALCLSSKTALCPQNWVWLPLWHSFWIQCQQRNTNQWVEMRGPGQSLCHPRDTLSPEANREKSNSGWIHWDRETDSSSSYSP